MMWALRNTPLLPLPAESNCLKRIVFIPPLVPHLGVSMYVRVLLLRPLPSSFIIIIYFLIISQPMLATAVRYLLPTIICLQPAPKGGQLHTCDGVFHPLNVHI
mmetsp:Transcript_10257/g.17194  ORF Transcript_10257/g.17194 Transcript_10257/m.17194 type:complete len:103 (-) Transcript_10257:1056-1364(-)